MMYLLWRHFTPPFVLLCFVRVCFLIPVLGSLLFVVCFGALSLGDRLSKRLRERDKHLGDC